MIQNQSVLDKIRGSNQSRVKVAIVDIDGILRGKYLHHDKFLSVLESGFGFCNVVFGWDSSDACYTHPSDPTGSKTYTGWHSGYPDARVCIDMATHRNIPWDGNVDFFLGDFETESGEPLGVCPRQLLKKMIAKAKSLGFQPSVGMEFEWFNFRETPQSLSEKNYGDIKPITPGMFGYSILRTTQNQPFFQALMEELSSFRVPLEGLHTETGPGVLEAAIKYSDALEAADRATLFKTAVKEIGHRFGILPSFMAKWNSALPGCGGHTHQSLWNLSGEKNLFYDEQDSNKMSTVFKHYLAGQLYCLPQILPFFAPTINSYKRLVEGYWAPTKSTWGIDNRTTAFRVIADSPKSTRVEGRVPGSDINSYLAIAACLGSGLYGIEKKMELKTPVTRGSAYLDTKSERLPRNLLEATHALERSEVAREIFGDTFINHFVQTRLWEWGEWQKFENSITQWELQRYFEII